MVNISKLKKVLITISILILIFNSCKKSTYSDHLNFIAEKFIGKSIIIPDNMCASFSMLNFKNFTIITYIDSSECTSCSLECIKRFSLYDFDQLYTEHLLVVRSVDEIKIKEILNNLFIDYPVIYDRNGEFKKLNKFLSESIFKTFVIDKCKSIVWLGSPIETNKTWKLFNKMINNSISKKNWNMLDKS